MTKAKLLLLNFFSLITNLSSYWWGQLILITVPVFIILSPLLLGFSVIAELDATNISYPFFTFLKEAISNNSSILINDLTLNGSASYAGTHIGFLSPLNWLFLKFLPIHVAYNWLMFIYLALGGFFVVRLLNELKCSMTAGLIAAYAFILSSSYVDLPVLAGTLWLPFVFWLLTYIYNRNSYLASILGGLAVGLGWLTVNSNWMIITIIGALIYAIFLIFVSKEHKKSSILLKYIIIFAVSSLIGLLQMIPSLVYLAISNRNMGEVFRQAITVGSLHFGSLIKLGLPLIEIPRLPWGTMITYLGILPLIFVVSTIFFKKNKKIIFFQVSAALCILIALPYSPLLKIISHIPVIGLLKTPSRWMFLGMFLMSILAGFGLDAWLKDNQHTIKNKIFKVIKWLVIIILVLTILLNIVYLFFNTQILELVYRYFDKNIYPSTSGLPLVHYHQIIQDQYFQTIKQFTYTNLRLISQLIIILISWFVFKSILAQRGQTQTWIRPRIILVVMLNLIFIFPFYLKTMPTKRLEMQPETAKFIKQKPGKIFAFLQEQTEYEKFNLPHTPSMAEFFTFQSELLVPNLNMIYGIPTADGHDSIMPERNAKLLALIGSSRVDIANVEGERLADLTTLEEKISKFNERQNVLDLLGIDYVISVYALTLNNNFVHFQTVTSTDYNIPFHIYQNTNPLTDIFVAKQVVYLDSGLTADNLKNVTQPAHDFHQTTFIECDNCLMDESNELSETKINIIKKSNTAVVMEYEGQTGNWLVVNQSNLPGWQAKINGQTTQIYYANLVHQAVFVPPGKHLITFEYTYPLKYFFEHLSKLL